MEVEWSVVEGPEASKGENRAVGLTVTRVVEAARVSSPVTSDSFPDFTRQDNQRQKMNGVYALS